MLKIHKTFSKKYSIIISTSILSIGVLLGLSFLIYTPELSHAESVTYKKTLGSITYMQEITPQICANTPEADTEGNYQYQLKDSRDEKTYWVAKLKDGNCWMTQNLDLDITTEGLKAKDTDIIKDWDSSSLYPPIATQKTSPEGFGDNDRFNSYNPGENYCINVKDGCGLKETLNGGHDAQGNYYSWNVATAHSGVDLLGDQEAPHSICAKGWHLPRGKDELVNGAFSSLLINTQPEDISLSPFYLVWGGYISYSNTSSPGSIGYYWTSTTGSPYASANNTKNNAYLLQLQSHDTSFSASTSRPLGASVRCMSPSQATAIDDNVEITVNPQLSLDAANKVTVEKTETNPSTADLNVKVSSNQKYTLGISVSNPNLISLTNNVKIPVKSGLLNTTENGWGIKKSEDTNYIALTNTPQTFYTASGAEIKTIPFIIGISTSPDIPNGEYSTNITITATQN